MNKSLLTLVQPISTTKQQDAAPFNPRIDMTPDLILLLNTSFSDTIMSGKAVNGSSSY
ncbi:MAG: hypothetical protein NVSMB38_44930 [Ktedonobacteraceae bacterium]